MSKCRYDLSEDCNNTDCLNCVLNKIRAEIEQLSVVKCTETRRIYINADDFKENVLAILNKYKAESEDKE